jgi:glycerol kinase
MTRKYILALDQGTTSSRSMLVDAQGRVAASAQEEFPQHFPAPGWVEHDPDDIWRSQRNTAEAVLEKAGVKAAQIAAIGIANQRETTVLWERATGRPVHRAIVWQCRRTSAMCESLKARGLEDHVRDHTGLLIDPYFSATKLRWLLDHVDSGQARAGRGELCFGTVDSWLLFKMTGEHATDYSNASRTMLFDIHRRQWDETLLAELDIPAAVLPEVKDTAGFFGDTAVFGADIPVTALVGDQQAALFGQSALQPGMTKNTYGTGCFLLMNTGPEAVASKHGLLTTIAWGLDNQVTYALEGSVFMGGAVIQWLRDNLGLLESAVESEAVALQVPDTGGVMLVPAFTGLGAPHWDMHARGTLTGLTRGTRRAHIVRAALEAIAYQSAEVVQTMVEESGQTLSCLRVDGGAAANNLLLQHQADLLGIPVERGQVLETTALGAAYLAGAAAGFWLDTEAIQALWHAERRFEPQFDETKRQHCLAQWKAAIARTKSTF